MPASEHRPRRGAHVTHGGSTAAPRSAQNSLGPHKRRKRTDAGTGSRSDGEHAATAQDRSGGVHSRGRVVHTYGPRPGRLRSRRTRRMGRCTDAPSPRDAATGFPPRRAWTLARAGRTYPLNPGSIRGCHATTVPARRPSRWPAARPADSAGGGGDGKGAGTGGKAPDGAVAIAPHALHASRNEAGGRPPRSLHWFPCSVCSWRWGCGLAVDGTRHCQR